MAGMEKKVQQLTKVIYHLNAKGEDAADVSDQANAYENEIEGILRDAWLSLCPPPPRALTCPMVEHQQPAYRRQLKPCGQMRACVSLK